MSYGPTETAEVMQPPAHVPRELVIDFDFYDVPDAATDPHLGWKKLHEGPPIVFTPRNGGHWILTRGAHQFAAMQDYSIFSSNPFNIPARPRGTPRTVPLEVDPPDLQHYRSLAIPMLSPKVIAALEPHLRASVIDHIEALKPAGGCEFVSEFAVPMPVDLFLRFVELPLEDRGRMREWVHTVSCDPSPEARAAAHAATHKYLSDVLEERRKNPGADLFSRIAAAENDGLIDARDAASMGLNILFGGIETTTSLLSIMMRFLAGSPAHRRELAEDPSLAKDAVEEFLRRFGILNLGRTLTTDIEFYGTQMKKGDRVLLPIHLYGLDEANFENPMTVDFHREHFRHIAFGTGPHRCLGSHLARPELRIFLEEWIRRIPDFSIAPGETPVGRSGSALAFNYLPLVWPG